MRTREVFSLALSWLRQSQHILASNITIPVEKFDKGVAKSLRESLFMESYSSQCLICTEPIP